MPARNQHAVEQRAAELTRRHGHLTGAALLRPMIEREFPGRIAVVSSFGAESAAVLGLIAEIDPARRSCSWIRASISPKHWPIATPWRRAWGLPTCG